MNNDLLKAIRQKQAPRVQHLIHHGADPAAIVRSTGRNAIHEAVLVDDDKVLETVLNNNTNADAVNQASKREGFTPLHFAAQTGTPKSVQLLMAAGADAGKVSEKTGFNAVHQAVLSPDRDKKALERMLLLNTNPDAVNQHSTKAEGLTPLHLAAQVQDVKAIEILLAAGANVHATTRHPRQTTERETPRYVATQADGESNEAANLLFQREQADLSLQGIPPAYFADAELTYVPPPYDAPEYSLRAPGHWSPGVQGDGFAVVANPLSPPPRPRGGALVQSNVPRHEDSDRSES